jgi:hypothetical protein
MSEHIEGPINSPTGRTTRAGAGPRLVVDTPIVAVIEAMGEDLRRLRRLEPSGGACHSLEHYYARFNDAMRDGLMANVWVSTEEAARLRDCTTSAITSLCRNGSVTAKKRGGVWEIHKDSVLQDTRKAG